MSIIIFVRHGEAQNNTKDILSSTISGYPLTLKGIRQVEATASQLKGVKLSGIFSSPVLRAMQTAKIINRYHGLDIKVDSRLRELSFGKLEGGSMPLRSRLDFPIPQTPNCDGSDFGMSSLLLK